MNQTKNIPTVFIIFGATGDLMAKKIAPALFHLYINGKFPNLFKIIAFSRRELTLADFQEHIRQILKSHKKKASEGDIESFLNYFMYQIDSKCQFDYKEQIGDIFYIEDGDNYILDGKLNTGLFDTEDELFI